jgi:hypothetical protein
MSTSGGSPAYAGLETKVKAGAGASSVSGAIVWALVAYVPAFHNGVPVPLTAVIPVIVSVLSGAVAAWLAPHTPRPAIAPASPPVPAVPPSAPPQP